MPVQVDRHAAPVGLPSDAVWSRFLISDEGRARLDMLPNDILVDHIISYLSLKDVFAMRRVNRAFNALTKQPAVWKRLILRYNTVEFPLPRVPPTSNYVLPTLRAVDIERIATRAISLDKNWRHGRPQPYRSVCYDVFSDVLSMVILPGAHFMVASTLSPGGRYAITLFAMEHPATGGPWPLAIRYTTTKAYFLQAKYLYVKGKVGIAIAFCRKFHKDREDTRDIPETVEMGGSEDPEDPEMPIKYECTTLHVSLESVDLMMDRHVQPGAEEFFRLAERQDGIKTVSRIRSGAQLGALALEEIVGKSFVAVVKRPDRVTIEDLTNNNRWNLKLLPNHDFAEYPHSILNVRFLPFQRQILVVRNIDQIPNRELYHMCLIEAYHLPPLDNPGLPTDVIEVQAFETSYLAMDIVNAQISDLPSLSDYDSSMWPALTKMGLETVHPPISIFLRTREENIYHINIHPIVMQIPVEVQRVDGTKAMGRTTRCLYALEASAHEAILDFRSGDFSGLFLGSSPRIVPGACRAVLYCIPADSVKIDPPVRGIFAYTNERRTTNAMADMLERLEVEAQSEHPFVTFGPPAAPVGEDRMWNSKAVAGAPSPASLFTAIRVPSAQVKQAQKGVRAVAWDEYSGVLLMATSKNTSLHVMDFGYARTEDKVDATFHEETDRALDIITEASRSSSCE